MRFRYSESNCATIADRVHFTSKYLFVYTGARIISNMFNAELALLLEFLVNIFNFAATASNSNSCMNKDYVSTDNRTIAKKFADEYSILRQTPNRILGREENISQAEMDNMKELCSCVIFKIVQEDYPDIELGIRHFNEIIESVNVKRDTIRFPIPYLLTDYRHGFSSFECELYGPKCIVAKGPANQSTTGEQEYNIYIGYFTSRDRFRFAGFIEKVNVEAPVYGESDVTPQKTENETPTKALWKGITIISLNPCLEQTYVVNTFPYLEAKFAEEYSVSLNALKKLLFWHGEAVSKNEKDNRAQLCACVIAKRIQKNTYPEKPIHIDDFNGILKKVTVEEGQVTIYIPYFVFGKYPHRFPATVCDYPERDMDKTQTCFIAKGPRRQSYSEPWYNLYIGSVQSVNGKDDFHLQGVMENVDVEDPIQETSDQHSEPVAQSI